VGTKKRVNKYPRAFQLMALERMKHCESVSGGWPTLSPDLGKGWGTDVFLTTPRRDPLPWHRHARNSTL